MDKDGTSHRTGPSPSLGFFDDRMGPLHFQSPIPQLAWQPHESQKPPHWHC